MTIKQFLQMRLLAVLWFLDKHEITVGDLVKVVIALCALGLGIYIGKHI